jgi:F0F1-type ATP synthase membrane subunit a
MESTKGDSIIELLVIDFIEEVGVIMIRYYFIQLAKTMLEGYKGFIHTHETIFATSVEFRHSNFGIKGDTFHLVSFFIFIIVMLLNFIPMFW